MGVVDQSRQYRVELVDHRHDLMMSAHSPDVYPVSC